MFTAGEIVAVNVGFGVEHYGIYVDNGMVISASKRRLMVCVESLEEFSQGGKIYTKGYPSKLPPHAVLRKARQKIGQKWSLSENCQHFATGCHEQRRSPALFLAMCVIGVAAGLVLLSRAKAA